MKRILYLAALLLCSTSLLAQSNLKESNFHLGVELQTKYVWRGIEQIPDSYNWLTVGLTDYYYPTTDTPEDQYFNFKSRETGHCFEGYFNIAPENIPAYLLFSTFFAGEDKNLDGKQAYSTYGELGGHYDFLGGHQLGLAVGATFNKSYYNGYAHNFSICNIELKYTYNLMIKDFALPLSVAYIINPVVEKAHVNLSASFEL